MVASFAYEDAEVAELSDKADVPQDTYLVRPQDPAAPARRGDIGWLDSGVISEYHAFSTVEGCARHYWRGDARPEAGGNASCCLN
jgi:hypothetical protein